MRTAAEAAAALAQRRTLAPLHLPVYNQNTAADYPGRVSGTATSEEQWLTAAKAKDLSTVAATAAGVLP